MSWFVGLVRFLTGSSRLNLPSTATGVITSIVPGRSGPMGDYAVVRCGNITVTFTVKVAWAGPPCSAPASRMWVVLSGVNMMPGGWRADSARPATTAEIPQQG
jgi:hypothetical protein